MADKILKLHQMLALQPVSIPDCVLDFLEDFGDANSLQRASVRTSLEPAYLQKDEVQLKTQLEALRKDLGAITNVQSEAIGKEFPGAYMCKIIFEKGTRGVGFSVRLKENMIAKVVFSADDYRPEDLKKALLA